MPRLKLTQRSVDAATAGDSAKVRIMDTELPNFGVRVLKNTNNGPGKKEYIIRYTDASGKTVEVSIGDARKIPCEEARTRAKAGLGEASKGADLLADRKVKRAAAEERRERTLAWVVGEYRKLRDAPPRPGRKPKRPRTVQTEDERLDALVIPKLGDRPVRDLRTTDVTTFLEEIESERTAIRATHARAALGLVLSYALRKGWVDFNAAKATEVPVRIGARTRLLSDEELRGVWIGGSRPSVAGRALRLAQLTLTRAGETASAQWDHIDFQKKLWTIPPDATKKGKEHLVPLCDAAIAVLEECRKTQEDKDHPHYKSKWVFPNKVGDGPIPAHRLTRKAHRLVASLDPEAPKFGPHDLRRTASTRLGPMGFNNFADIMSRVLSHQSREGSDSLGHYVHYDFLKEKREFLEAWAKELSRIVKRKQPAH